MAGKGVGARAFKVLTCSSLWRGRQRGRHPSQSEPRRTTRVAPHASDHTRRTTRWATGRALGLLRGAAGGLGLATASITRSVYRGVTALSLDNRFIARQQLQLHRRQLALEEAAPRSRRGQDGQSAGVVATAAAAVRSLGLALDQFCDTVVDGASGGECEIGPLTATGSGGGEGERGRS